MHGAFVISKSFKPFAEYVYTYLRNWVGFIKCAYPLMHACYRPLLITPNQKRCSNTTGLMIIKYYGSISLNWIIN